MKSKFACLLIVITVFGLTFAQDNPVTVSLEVFIVNEITLEDGSTEVNYISAESARPGQIVEYRLTATNVSEQTLPPRTVVVTGPVPEGTTFVEDSVVLNPQRYLVEYSADGNTSFAEQPTMSIENDSGQTEGVIAPPEDYSAVRWTLVVALEPNKSEQFSYRITVN